MVSLNRITEVYRFYVYREPSNEQSSINRFEILRERLGKIIKAEKLRSIQLAILENVNGIPFQYIIQKMSNDDFGEFIDNNTSGKRRKELFNKYS